MTPRRATLLIGVPAVLAAVVLLLVLPRAERTDEERVRAVFAEVVAAALDEDFGAEWDLFAAEARGYWEEQLAGWKELAPDADLYDDLREAHGIEREDLLPMDGRGFFAACRSGEARRDALWWTKEREALRTLPPGEFSLGEDGTARLTFEVDTDPEYDIEHLIAEFLREDGAWRLREVAVSRMHMRTLPWREPPLELPFAEGAVGDVEDSEVGIVVNLLADGRVVVAEEAVDDEGLRDRIAASAEGKRRVFRCDRRVSWADAAPRLALLLRAAADPVVLSASNEPEGRCRMPRKGGEPGFQTVEPGLDLAPPPPDLDRVGTVVPVGPEPKEAEGLDPARLSPPVLLTPSPDAPWDAVVRVLATLRAAGVGDVLLTAPGEGAPKDRILGGGGN